MKTPIQPDYSASPTIEGPFKRITPPFISERGLSHVAAADFPEPVSRAPEADDPAARKLLEDPEMLAEAAEIHAAWAEKRKGEFLERARVTKPSITEDEVKEALREAVYGDLLPPEFELVKEDGTPIPSIDALEELWNRYVIEDDAQPKMKLRGVLEPDYHDGAQVAVLYLNFGE